MLATTVLSEALATLLSTNVATLNPAGGAEVKLVLLAADFVEDPTLILMSSLTEATFDGYAAKASGAGAPPVNVDPLTGEQIITIKEPAGGWHFACTGVTGLPQQIFGYAVVDQSKTNVYALKRFDDPITIAAVGHFVEVGAVTLRFVTQPIS